MSARARRTALLAAATVGVLAPAAPALATTTSPSGLPHGLSDVEYNVMTTAPDGFGGDTMFVDLNHDFGAWTFQARWSHTTYSEAGGFHTVEDSTGVVPLDASAVSVSPSGNSLTFTTPELTYSHSDYQGGPTVITPRTTTATGSFKVAGGDVASGNNSYTEKCGTADHIVDRVRIADGTVAVFGQTVSARGDQSGYGSTMVYSQTNGTVGCS